MLTRRELIQLAAASGALLPFARFALADKKMKINTRAIPRTGEQLPVVGMGTWQTFDVGSGADVRKPIGEVLATYFAAGGRLIDSSPMYGRAEEVTGDEVANLKSAKPFLATKVWTSGKLDGIEQMTRSMKRMRTKRMDLMQVHNLVDVNTHLPVLRDWKAKDKIRYLGVTHYQHGQFDAIEKLMKQEKLDFVQIPYSIVDRRAEQRILPVAAETGTAVLVMTPFESGNLFDQVKGRPLPALAADIDCTSWAQFFLKFIIGHPAVLCPIPATSKVKHMADNIQAAYGRLPDAKQREQMVKAFMQK